MTPSVGSSPVATPPQRRSSVKGIAALCFLLGGGMGFFAGVMSVKGGRDFIAGLVKTEQKASVGSPITVERPAFRFQHAGNWKIDVADKDYDADHNFSVETPGQSFVMIQIADGILEPRAVVETHTELQTAKIVKQATRTPFTRWGAYTGEGVLLRGKLLGLMQGSVRIFSFRSGESTYTVVESTYDEDRASVSPGFELIERSFHVKQPPPER